MFQEIRSIFFLFRDILKIALLTTQLNVAATENNGGDKIMQILIIIVE